MRLVSPFSGRVCNAESFSNDPHLLPFNEEPESGMGSWVIAGCHLKDNSIPALSDPAHLAVARSHLWLQKHVDSKPVFLHPPNDVPEGAFADNYTLLSFEQCIEEAAQLTFEAKALMTLQNLRRAETHPGDGVVIPYSISSFPGRVCCGFDPGITYGALPKEAVLIHHYLQERNLIRAGEIYPESTRVYLTAAGYELADRLRKGFFATERRAFLVCRFNDEMEGIYTRVYSQIGRTPPLDCPIYRTKDSHDINRIDDRMLREIRDSLIVVVDLTGHNFNVGFEAGYAMSLGKPIVFTRKASEVETPMPFDIQGFNVLFWDEARLEEFAENLTYRMLFALEKAHQSA